MISTKCLFFSTFIFRTADVSGVTTNSVADELSSTNNHKLMSGRSVSSLISVGSTSDWNIIEYQGDNNANDKIGVSISGSLINIHASHFGNSDEEGIYVIKIIIICNYCF